MPESTALNRTKSLRVRRATIVASVVLPEPGGPHKIMEPNSSRSIWRRSALPGPRIWSWPTKSSMVSGLMRSAKGEGVDGRAVALPGGSGGWDSKRLIKTVVSGQWLVLSGEGLATKHSPLATPLTTFHNPQPDD